eukprot:3600246-Lingulodinium_polyedra.AAC.1
MSLPLHALVAAFRQAPAACAGLGAVLQAQLPREAAVRPRSTASPACCPAYGPPEAGAGCACGLA